MRSLYYSINKNSNGLVMGVTVGANGLSIVHKGSGGEANATLPDVCLTTVGKPVVPIPYGNNAKSADLLVALRLSRWMVATVSRSKAVRSQKVLEMRAAIKKASHPAR
ncbi:DUF4150 domain-containing protein [Vibrio vulnificus]|nr:DUF4150 domain-containing protein [Vibrio vulnificus]